MRATALILAVVMGSAAVAQDQPAPPPVKLLITHYGVKLDTDTYPQKTPKDTLASVIRAIQAKRSDYLLAQLVDPAFVDQRVQDYHSGKFEPFVEEFGTRLLEVPETLRNLQRFAKDGEWAEAESAATAKIKGVKDVVYFRKIEDRWFMENRK
jgi:hypothetical protein